MANVFRYLNRNIFEKICQENFQVRFDCLRTGTVLFAP